MPQQLFFTVAAFLAPIQKTLRDVWGIQFDPATELLPHLNDATSEIVNRDDQALVKNIPFQLLPVYVSIITQGSGYAQGDTITLGGGTQTSPIVLDAAGVNSSGGLDMVAVASYGSYTAYPPNPVSQSATSGTGTGATFKLTLAGPKQELPPDGASLIEVRRNLGADGQTFGNIITKVPRDDMDASRPQWPTDVCGVNGAPAAPIHYVMDDRDPKRWYPWPWPNVMTNPWFVELIYRGVPDNVGMNDAFPLPALYEPAARFYVIAHAMMRLDEDDRRWKKCQELYPVYLKLFEQSLTSTKAAVVDTTPSDAVNRP